MLKIFKKVYNPEAFHSFHGLIETLKSRTANFVMFQASATESLRHFERIHFANCQADRRPQRFGFSAPHCERFCFSFLNFLLFAMTP